MFEELLKKYKLDTKDYIGEVKIIQDDIDYLLAHYYRTRLNTTFDIIIILPKADGDKNNLIMSMFANSKISWKDNLDKFLPAIDIINAIMTDINILSTGKRETIIQGAWDFQNQLNNFTKINLSDYFSDFIVKPEIVEEALLIWNKLERSKNGSSSTKI
jgi:hypothetical protein